MLSFLSLSFLTCDVDDAFLAKFSVKVRSLFNLLVSGTALECLFIYSGSHSVFGLKVRLGNTRR